MTVRVLGVNSHKMNITFMGQEQTSRRKIVAHLGDTQKEKTQIPNQKEIQMVGEECLRK